MKRAQTGDGLLPPIDDCHDNSDARRLHVLWRFLNADVFKNVTKIIRTF